MRWEGLDRIARTCQNIPVTIMKPCSLGTSVILTAFILGVFGTCLLVRADEAPEPAVVDPGPPGGVPSDAIILFDGKDLSKWKGQSGGEAKWKVQDGYMEVTKTG